MSKHTKAPWKVVENGDRMAGVMSGNNWVTYKAGQDRMTTEELEANANLIAAAPDLLEALAWMVEHCEPRLDHAPDCIRSAKRAISKARGES